MREGKLNEAHQILAETAESFYENGNKIGLVVTLEAMASLKVLIEKFDVAAYLIGWADKAREELGDMRWRIEQADVDKIIAACIDKLGEVAFSDAYEEGKKMTMDEAVAYALQES